jgi:hypothetical protein
LLKVPIDFSNPDCREYFLVENRNCCDTSGFLFDHYSNYFGSAMTKDSGIIITHVDELAGAWGSNNGTPGADHYWAWIEDPGEPLDLRDWPHELKVDAAFSTEDDQIAFTPYTLPYDSQGYDGPSELFIVTESNSGATMQVDISKSKTFSYPSILVLNHTGDDHIGDPDIPFTYAKQDSIWVVQTTKGGYFNLDLRPTLPQSLDEYDVIAYLMSWEGGMSPGGLSASEKEAISDFIESGGAVYAEGPDVADMMSGSELFDHFGCSFDGETQGGNCVTDLYGYGGSLASGMCFEFDRSTLFTGVNSYVDELSAAGGFRVLYDQGGIDRTIANPSGAGRTVISSVILAGMSDGESPSFKADLSASYISFLLGITPVVVSGLSAEAVEDGILLSWMSAELPGRGFNIYRKTPRDRPRHFDKINEFPVLDVSFLDPNVEPNAEYYYKLGAIDLDGREVLFGPVRAKTGPKVATAPLSVSPNPFNPSIEIAVPDVISETSSLEIYDISGRRIRTLHSDAIAGGSVKWGGTDDNGRTLPSGVYFIRLVTETQTFSTKATLLE